MRILAAVVAILCGSSFGAGAVEIETALGKVDVPPAPRTVAVFDIAALDTLDRLGIAAAGVPDKTFVPELAKTAAKAARVGTLFEPDLEALNQLQPDLVIVGGRSSPRLAETKRIAPSIDMTIDGSNLIAGAKARLAAYGVLFQRLDEAAAAEKEIDAAVEKARAAISGKGRGLIVMTAGPRVSIYGTGTRFGWLHRDLGLEPAIEATATTPHGESASFELIAKADPDWLIVLDRTSAIGQTGDNARATLDNALVARTTAWRKGQVIYLPPADFYIAGGGVQALGRVLATLTDAFSRAP